MDILLNVSDTALTLNSQVILVSTQVNYDVCAFTFGPEWDGYIKTAVFYSAVNAQRIPILVGDDDKCFIPWESIFDPGSLYVGVFGIKGKTEIPTNFVMFKSIQGSAGSNVPPPPTLDIYEQILNKIGDLKIDSATGVEIHEELQSDISEGTPLDISLKADIATGTPLDISLKADIATGTPLDIALKADISLGNPLDVSLKDDIATGNTLDTALKADIATGTPLDASLKADITAGNILDTSLKSDISLGNPLDVSLKADIATGNTLDTALKADIATGTPLDTSLKADISTGTTLDTALKADISTGTPLDVALKADITLGNPLDVALKADIANGNTLDTALKADVATGTPLDASLKADITAGNILDTSLKADISTGNPLDVSLKADIATGTPLDVTLKADIATGTPLDTSLKADITTGTSLDSSLKSDITTGTALDTSLKADISTGTPLDTALKADIATATPLDTSLKASITGGGAIQTAEAVRIANDLVRTTNETDRQTRFNLLTTAQQQAAEVTNARTSTIKVTTFPAITNRIEAIEVVDASTTTILTALDNSVAGNIRETIPSGFTQLSDLDYTFMSTNPNTIKTLTDSVAFVNGYKTLIPKATVITLNAPPKANYINAQGIRGIRDDLVFLECYKTTDVNGIVTWNSRYRVVDGVDFVTYPEGMGGTYGNAQVMAQGVLSLPLTSTDWTLANQYGFRPSKSTFYPYRDDSGLYIAGYDAPASKIKLLTSDGYSYAIPMYRVTRRNDGGFAQSYEYQHLGVSNKEAFGRLVNQDRVTHSEEVGNKFIIEGNTTDMYSGGIIGIDFKNKISGSVVENPNVFRQVSTNGLQIPSAINYELPQTFLDMIKTLDATCSSDISAPVNGQIPQHLFSFDVIKNYEKKYGVIPSVTQSVADKIVWLKLNASLIPKWYGYGSCPSGFKAYLDYWDGTLNWWAYNHFAQASAVSHGLSSPNLLSMGSVGKFIDSNGFCHLLAYTDAASATSPTLLVMSGHGLSLYDLVENVTRGNSYSQVTGLTTNSIVCSSSIASQSIGDTINKYHSLRNTSAETGTTTTNIIITAHSLSTGDYIANNARGSFRKITVVDANTINLSSAITGQIVGDNISLLKLSGTQNAEGTTTTQLQLTGHGLVAGDIFENVTRSIIVAASISIVNANMLTMPAVTSQTGGDIINKYHRSIKVAETGTTTTNITITAHGLSTGDVIANINRSGTPTKITVVDVNNFTVSIQTGQVIGDTIYCWKSFGTQTAESGVIPSTIYTDYVSLDITLKPSYKSVGEDVGGTGVHQVGVLGRGKNLINLNAFTKYLPTDTLIINGDNITLTSTYYCLATVKVKPSTNYYFQAIRTVDGDAGGTVKIYNSTMTSLVTPGGTGNFTFNTGTNTIIVIVMYSSFGTLTTKTFSNIQLEEGTTATPYTPYTEVKKTLKLAQPLRRVSPTVADVYKSGQVARNVSGWNVLDGNADWRVSGSIIGSKECYNNIPVAPLGVSNNEVIIKNNGLVLTHANTNTGGDTSCLSVGGLLYLRAFNVDTGFVDSYIPTQPEWKSYFYGYKMCHTDGVSPYQVSEVPYTPSTWAEWSSALTTLDITGAEITATGSILCGKTIKTSTKYGFLFNVVSNNLSVPGNLFCGGGITYPFNSATFLTSVGQVGNVKGIVISNTGTSGFVQFNVSGTAGTKIKLKDIRIFELPTGSTIETDFNTMTADQLTAKYLFYGLNPKNWKSVVDGSGQTAVLPTTQAPNYTPYQMLYQLANPVIENNDLAWMYYASGVNNINVDGGVTVPNLTVRAGTQEVSVVANNNLALTLVDDVDVRLKKNFNGAMLKASGVSDRFDGTYADIIADRDIVKLLHQVSLTGFSYQSMLEENFDRLLRSEL